MKTFPIIKAGYIFNDAEWKHKIKGSLKYKSISIFYPARLDAMAINPAAVAYNDEMQFTPGEVVVSIGLGINVSVKVLQSNLPQGVVVSNKTKRKVLVNHAYGLMKNIFNNIPAMEIDVDDSQVLKHCGFGSSSSTIAAVCVCINELYGRPIKNSLLIKYLAANHGEEVSNENENDLKVVQCIGGGATGGMTAAGVIIIAGKATTIAKMKYNGSVLIAVPNSFKEKPAKELMELEEQNLWKFEKTGNQYKDIIAYNLLHKALPEMANGKINALADVVFEYRFNMGSNNNCAFVCDEIYKLNKTLPILYKEKHCKFLALSSVGPAFFAIVDNKKDLLFCKKYFEKQDMNVKLTSVFNSKYKILKRS